MSKIVSYAPIRRTRAHNAAFVAMKANKSDPFLFGRTVTEQTIGCASQGTVEQVIADSTRCFKLNPVLSSEQGAAIKRTLGMQ